VFKDSGKLPGETFKDSGTPLKLALNRSFPTPVGPSTGTTGDAALTVGVDAADEEGEDAVASNITLEDEAPGVCSSITPDSTLPSLKYLEVDTDPTLLPVEGELPAETAPAEPAAPPPSEELSGLFQGKVEQ